MDFFDPDPEGMVKPRDLVRLFTRSGDVGGDDLSLPPRALVTFSHRMLNHLVRVSGANRVESWRGRISGLFLAKVAESPVALVLSPCGAPAASMLLEELIAFGVTRAVLIGYCGSIQDEFVLGDVILPTRAVREEGTSHHYLPMDAECRPDAMLLGSLHRWLRQSGMTSGSGAIWTTDAPYRETREKVELYRAKGVLAVDMEMAALFAVGAVRRVEVVGLALVSDGFSQSGWRPGFFDPLLLERERVVSEVTLRWIGDEH